MAQGLHFHPTAFPLGGCLGRGTWEALSGAVESDGIEGEGGCRQEADSPIPWIITLVSPNVSRPFLQRPFLRTEPAICNFPTSPFPSPIFRTGLTDVPGLLNSR